MDKYLSNTCKYIAIYLKFSFHFIYGESAARRFKKCTYMQAKLVTMMPSCMQALLLVMSRRTQKQMKNNETQL